MIRKLREGERLIGEGSDLAAVCKHLEVSEQTWHRWRNQYGGMKAEDAKRLKELEKQNARLKKLVAEQALQTVRGADTASRQTYTQALLHQRGPTSPRAMIPIFIRRGGGANRRE